MIAGKLRAKAVVYSLFIVSSFFCGTALAEVKTKFEVKWATKATIEQLQKGGFVLYMRHGPTDTSQPDRVPDVDLNDCSTQRPLTEEGRKVSEKVGAAIRRLNIPVGDIIVSPMCRTKETAEAAFGEGYKINLKLRYSSNFTTEKKLVASKVTRGLLSNPVEPGANRVLVAHGPNLMDIMGYFVKPEATIVIFRPLGEGKSEYIANIEPDQWRDF